MQLATARRDNVHSEEENMIAQGKKQALNTPRHALGNVKNMATSDRGPLRASTPMPKPTLQTVSSNLDFSASRRSASDLCSSRRSLISRYPNTQPITLHTLDTSDDVIEECSLKEDQSDKDYLLPKSDIILSNADNEAEYFQKLISEGYGALPDISEEELPIETCGPEYEPDDYDDIINRANEKLTEDSPSYQYERPDQDGLNEAKRYTLEEMEKLFDSFNDPLWYEEEFRDEITHDTSFVNSDEASP